MGLSLFSGGRGVPGWPALTVDTESDIPGDVVPCAPVGKGHDTAVGARVLHRHIVDE